MKKISGRCRIAPFAVLKSGHIEMQEHAQAQIHEPLLEILEWQSATQSCAPRIVLLRCGAVIRGQHRCDRCSGGQLEELSPGRHFGCAYLQQDERTLMEFSTVESGLI
jgi:hypothetical protein